ncbi:MAG: exodeoxyribonuclease III [Lentimicrobiaceae bacterium]|jgi:exodeoxyribonuclease-3|nr:exodeoxyribonuclease III [Lentimicrobiaceae bacterium]MCP4909661.1 exodeoxyribonuclease III [Bacteroidota bacterium]MBT3454748.1 exodeoxyribonuclease III [Lentimicrobiaceae bacterium]MBT3819648.1 exodeoxyribonuclease III [Lentimicrobiaceae bacterium]MBT4061274.1 exodeoxyribonuclease III [Lentimicrobiaceae bacterium]
MNLKIISWNVNGIRAIHKKGFDQIVKDLAPDVLCLQETKAQDDQVREVLFDSGYDFTSNSAIRKGYSGTAIMSKSNPINTTPDIGIENHDNEGRVLTAEYEHFYLVNVYVPNSGSELVRIDYRKQWDIDFLRYLKDLEKNKPVVLCGDLNVAHQPMDLSNPKNNYNKTAGYTQVEIDGFNNLLDAGFVDTFRAKYPTKVAYSWWSYRFSARARNIGWRIDYFMVSNSIADKVTDAFILPKVMGSDHCPVGVNINF